MSNPLLTFTDLPPFSQIKPEHIKPAVEQAIADCRAKIDEVLQDNAHPTWDSVIAPIEEADDRLSRIWSPVGHMNSVVNSEELREAYESCLPILSEYGTWVGQHKGLYEA
ncbi:oligopeptidase A, partial [Vibrio sp. Vb2362]|nr:oligopeptidase A [Vibrio sp. Vb2362]